MKKNYLCKFLLAFFVVCVWFNMKAILNHRAKTTCRITIILSIVCSIFFQGCKTETIGDEPIVSKNYVQSFILCDSIDFDIDTAQNNLHLAFLGEDIQPYDERFHSLTEHFGDTAYNKESSSIFHTAIADEFISIDLISDRDFDTSHSAGKSLKDIVKFHGISPYKYITSGYTDEFDWNGDDIPEGFDMFSIEPRTNGYHPVYKLLPALTLDDLKLLGKFSNISFTVKPPSGEHSLTLTFKTATAIKELKTTKTVVFN
jgi:hypothetical protein